jgi:hypothetical protein
MAPYFPALGLAISIWQDRFMKRIVNAVGLTIAVYGLAAWVYVAAVAIAQPRTLSWQLTHLARWPRTDTFGEASFVCSFLGFLSYRLTRERDR